MDVREKLVEIFCSVLGEEPDFSNAEAMEFVEELIANGVMVQEWISVKDRLPEQGKEIIVYSGGVLKPTVFAYQFWNKHYDSWARITHWMPLPPAPKGE